MRTRATALSASALPQAEPRSVDDCVPTSAASASRTLSALGRHGETRFFLQRVAGGLYVEREEIPRRGLRTWQSIEFADAQHFGTWCDADPVRFEYPLLHAKVRREADALWHDRGADGSPTPH